MSLQAVYTGAVLATVVTPVRLLHIATWTYKQTHKRQYTCTHQSYGPSYAPADYVYWGSPVHSRYTGVPSSLSRPTAPGKRLTRSATGTNAAVDRPRSGRCCRTLYTSAGRRPPYGHVPCGAHSVWLYWNRFWGTPGTGTRVLEL